MKVMHSGKQHISNILNSVSSVSVSLSLSVRAALIETILYLARFLNHIKLATCLEQIVLCTFSIGVQSVSSLGIFFSPRNSLFSTVLNIHMPVFGNEHVQYCFNGHFKIWLKCTTPLHAACALWCKQAQHGWEAHGGTSEGDALGENAHSHSDSRWC